MDSILRNDGTTATHVTFAAAIEEITTKFLFGKVFLFRRENGVELGGIFRRVAFEPNDPQSPQATLLNCAVNLLDATDTYSFGHTMGRIFAVYGQTWQWSARNRKTAEETLVEALRDNKVSYASLLENLRSEWDLPAARQYVIRYIGDLQSVPEHFGVGPFECRTDDYARIERLARLVIHAYQTLEYGRKDFKPNA